MSLGYRRYEIDVPKGNAHYANENFRIYAKRETMEPAGNFHTLQHIHEDFEVMHILEGYLWYHIDGKLIKMETGDAVFINSNEMHGSELKESSGCRFEIVLVHPSIYTSIPTIVTRYLNPLMRNPDLAWMHFAAGTKTAQRIGEIIHRMVQAEETAEDGSELIETAEAVYLLKEIWSAAKEKRLSLHREDSHEVSLLNQMTACIYQGYSEKLSLNEIAESASVSVSTANRIFRTYLDRSPVDFLNQCRLEAAAGMLRNIEKAISEIALDCGFSQQSYFNRMFKREYGVTPASYRKCPNDSYVH
jgi:AraC-like DNA-binding protein